MRKTLLDGRPFDQVVNKCARTLPNALGGWARGVDGGRAACRRGAAAAGREECALHRSRAIAHPGKGGAEQGGLGCLNSSPL